MRAWLLALVACGSKEKEPPPPPKPVADAAIVDDWIETCEAALTSKLTRARKLSTIIDSCKPCGDWKPLLDWNTPMPDGGPPEQTILDAMDRCNAYCTKDSKMQFAGALPDARGKSTNKPWKILGDKCKDAVSAVPDNRFMSAPYFALDRIARAASANAKLAPLLAAVDVPLPAVSITGVGFELPTSPVMKPEVPDLHVTVTANELRMGTLPRGKLGATGVTVDHGTMPYPGELVTEKDLATKLPPDRAIVIIAPGAIPAARLVDIVAAAGKRDIVLAAAAAGGPKGWTLPGHVPVLLDATPTPTSTAWNLDDVDKAIADLKAKPDAAFDHPRVTITKDATVAQLAKLLGALAFRDARSASLVKK